MNWFALVSEVVNRIPVERLLTRQPDNKKRLEELQDILGSAKPEPADQSQAVPEDTIYESLAEIAKEARGSDIATGCVPCAIGHFGTCAGLLNEAMRFARKDGIASDEVINRINACTDEISALERIDLRPEMIVSLPAWEKELADKALVESRNIRHRLEMVSTVDDLEQLAAMTQTSRNEIGRAWFKYRLSHMSEAEKTEVGHRAFEKIEEVINDQ